VIEQTLPFIIAMAVWDIGRTIIVVLVIHWLKDRKDKRKNNQCNPKN
jgi:hypothetical protein